MRDGYLARWRGRDYDASPEQDEIRLYHPDPQEGFEQVRPGRFRRVVPAAEVDELVYLRTTCTWQNEPFIVIGEHEGWLRVEYTGGLRPVAEALGLEEYDYGVYQGWAPIDEVRDVREVRA